jgi:RNA polymerase sigma-70 factor (ECF subfamily)
MHAPPTASTTDQALLRRVGQGDAHAFEALYDRHSARAYGLALRLCGERALAEEVTQDAFLAVWRRAATYDAARGSAQTWILCIVHHRAIDGLRRRGRDSDRRAGGEGLEERLEAPVRTDLEAARRELARSMHAALATLPVAQREAIVLSLVAELTHREIACALGAPLGTVKGRIRLGTTKMRRALAHAA